MSKCDLCGRTDFTAGTVIYCRGNHVCMICAKSIASTLPKAIHDTKRNFYRIFGMHWLEIIADKESVSDANAFDQISDWRRDFERENCVDRDVVSFWHAF